MSRPVKVEVVFAPLQSCLVNLPPSLIALISNTNTSVQNVIVEFQYRSQTLSSGAVSSGNAAGFQRSAYAGWTGMPSKSRPASVLSNERSRGSKDNEISTVEIDPTFARAVGLSEGQITGLMLHLDPPLAHSINIEPATPSDWELIELHANFLEINFLAQIRALPNPAYTRKDSTQTELNHPLTLYLTPTSTATILVTSLTPPKSASQPFAKIASDAEVIVAPKTRQKPTKHARNDTRSIGSRRSRQSITSVRTSGYRKAPKARDAVFLRGVDYEVAKDFVEGTSDNTGLVIWLSQSTIISEALGGSVFVRVSVVRPAGLREQPDDAIVQKLKEEEASNAGRPAQRLVARVATWRKPTDDRHAVLSPMLSTLLGVSSFSGLLLRVDCAPSPIARSALKSFVFHPFTAENHKKSDGLKFGGESYSAKQALSDRLRITHGGNDGLLSGPLTDGMIIPPSSGAISMTTFDGGILRFNTSRDQEADGEGLWCIGGEQRQDYDVKEVIPRPVDITTLFPTFKHDLPLGEPRLIGVDDQLKKSLDNLTLCSSILLTGGIGAGKTAVAAHIGRELRENYLFNVNYFSCQKLVNDETRVSTIKETLQRYFASASWCSRLGGQSVVILDDLDKICPVETELQVGNDNGRSRQVTEILCSIVRQFCSISGGVTLLATASSKDALHNTLIGGHVFSEIVSLKAPSKDVRNQILAHLTTSSAMLHDPSTAPNSHSRNSNSMSETSWMNPSRPTSSNSASQAAQVEGFHVSSNLDLLDIAGRTDGYMPADLSLLVARARNEALIRTLSAPSSNLSTQLLTLTAADFTAALKNFTPTSLRNVTLTHSTTTFSSIGGLSSTRATLLETLLYPTKYAPIFARSPLRLRSGLLLYGYPGCGKTLLASAVAGECNLNFISVKGPEILNKYIGASEKSVRDLFERAQAAKPCVLFFDEFDSIAPKRGHDSTGVTDRVVNQMLTQMDGAEGLDGVYVLAATSRPDLIDPALLRPGRLDKSLLCDMPDLQDREDILSAVSVKLHTTPEVKRRMEEVARRTEGFSGADLQALMYNAHLEAIHDLLGDVGAGGKAKTANGEVAQEKKGGKSRKGEKHDFIQFLYDKEADEAARKSITSHAFDTQAMIVKKLEELKIARKREKAALRGQRFDPVAGKDEAEEKGEDEVKVSIGWQHIQRSLATTRSSISPQERKRLAAIYQEFVQGRNGEMPNGEGNRDVGGRTSLM